jgi:hypothetical protein
MDSVVLVLVRDLLFTSKITGEAKLQGISVKLIRDPQNLEGEAGDRLIVDLNQPGALEAAVQWKSSHPGTVIGFVSHVDRETIERARSGGIDQVLPRSQFVQRLAELIKSG